MKIVVGIVICLAAVGLGAIVAELRLRWRERRDQAECKRYLRMAEVREERR